MLNIAAAKSYQRDVEQKVRELNALINEASGKGLRFEMAVDANWRTVDNRDIPNVDVITFVNPTMLED